MPALTCIKGEMYRFWFTSHFGVLKFLFDQVLIRDRRTLYFYTPDDRLLE